MWEGQGRLSDKTMGKTALLCLFFGVAGAHRFYVGKFGTGMLMLFSAGGFIIWAIIDLYKILIGEFTDEEGRVIK